MTSQSRNALVISTGAALLVASACAFALGRGRSAPITPDDYRLSDERMVAKGLRVLMDPTDRTAPAVFGRIQRVYVAGKGPKVIMLHELPGLRDGDIEVAVALSNDFEVYAPLLFGVAGQDDSGLGRRQACKGGLFRCDDRNTRHPITADLLALAQRICGNSECGVIGMCLTGTLPLSLMPAEGVVALVIAQPTLPIVWHIWPFAGLDISEEDTKTAMELAASRQASVYMVRYRHDWISGRSAFTRLVKRVEPWKSKLSFFDVVEVPAHGHSTLVHNPAEPNVAKQQIEAVKRALNARLRRGLE